MSRIADLSIPRKMAERAEHPFTVYWEQHSPDAYDLADLFKISARRVRELWQEGWLTKGANLMDSVRQWRTYQSEVLGRDGHVGGAPRHRG